MDAIEIQLNEAMEGKLRSTGSVTLTAGQATTVVADRRVGIDSVIVFSPMTANAAGETMYVSATGAGTFTITHQNAASTDRTFNYIIIGTSVG